MTKDAQFALRRGGHAARVLHRGRRCQARHAAAALRGRCSAAASPPSPPPPPLAHIADAPTSPWPCSHREVHPQRPLLPDLQLRQQDHPGAAEPLHALQVPSPEPRRRPRAAAARGGRRRVRCLLRQPLCALPWRDAGRRCNRAALPGLPAAACRVKLGEGGMDALITLGAGDMRRTLNILQVGECGCRLGEAAGPAGWCRRHHPPPWLAATAAAAGAASALSDLLAHAVLHCALPAPSVPHDDPPAMPAPAAVLPHVGGCGGREGRLPLHGQPAAVRHRRRRHLAAQ